MKKITFFMLLVLGSVYSQRAIQCGSEAPDMARMKALAELPSRDNPSTIYVIKVFFHIINDDFGNTPSDSGNQFGEAQVLEAMKYLNMAYSPYKIYFKLVEYDTHNDTYLTEHGSFTNLSPLSVPDCFNIYFVKDTVIGDAWGMMGNTTSAFSFTALEQQFQSTIVHEIGHNMNLLHTFNNYETSYCEHVERSGPNYNAATAGDMVEDTPAQPPVGPLRFNNCVYIDNPNMYDCQGTPYQNILPNNYMGWDDELGCTYHFTPGQVQRMRNYLASPGSFWHYPLCYTSVESLYEPYDISVIVGNTIISQEDQQENGGLYVCRNQLAKLRFIPGIAYEFSDTTQGIINVQPQEFFIYNNEINHLIGMKIPAISDDIHYMGEVNSALPFFCRLEPYVTGTLLYTQILGSMNITVEELSAIRVKDPNLYETLLSQYYYILKKETDAGTRFEGTFYKY